MEDEKRICNHMMIKRLYVLFELLLTISICSSAQTQIEGFWGVKLGDTERNVVSKVRQSYPNADYNRDTKGHPFTATKVSLAGVECDRCVFTFTNGTFTKYEFNHTGGWKQVHVCRVQSFLNSLTLQMHSDYQ